MVVRLWRLKWMFLVFEDKMDGWMDGLMDGLWADKWMDGLWADNWVDEWVDRRTDGWFIKTTLVMHVNFRLMSSKEYKINFHKCFQNIFKTRVFSIILHPVQSRAGGKTLRKLLFKKIITVIIIIIIIIIITITIITMKMKMKIIITLIIIITIIIAIIITQEYFYN